MEGILRLARAILHGLQRLLLFCALHEHRRTQGVLRPDAHVEATSPMFAATTPATLSPRATSARSSNSLPVRVAAVSFVFCCTVVESLSSCALIHAFRASSFSAHVNPQKVKNRFLEVDWAPKTYFYPFLTLFGATFELLGAWAVVDKAIMRARPPRT
eukprot:3429888-Amphidinium_carterae.1